MLREIASSKLQIQKPDGLSKNKKIGFMSNAMSELTEIHTVVCKNNKLDIKRCWLNHLDRFWWSDDGSITGKGRQGVFCTDDFTLRAHEILQQYLHVVWGIETRRGGYSKKHALPEKIYYRLYIKNRSELEKFIRLVMPLMILPAMLKKVALIYRDPELQQRWIFEMKAVMPTLHMLFTTL